MGEQKETKGWPEQEIQAAREEGSGIKKGFRDGFMQSTSKNGEFGEVERHWPRSELSRGRPWKAKCSEEMGQLFVQGQWVPCLKCQQSPYTHSSSKDTHSPAPGTREERGWLCSCGHRLHWAESIHLHIVIHCRGCRGRDLIP